MKWRVKDMMELVFKHELRAEDVRNMCINMKFYTKGDNKAYSKMLDMCSEDVTPDTFLTIANDIVEHSDEDNEYLAEYEPVDEVICYLTDLIKTKVYSRRVSKGKTQSSFIQNSSFKRG